METATDNPHPQPHWYHDPSRGLIDSLNENSAGQLDWYYADAQNESVGPVSFAELKRLAAEGTIRDETYVIREGGAEWKSFASLLPPPLPRATNNLAGLVLLWRSHAFTKRGKIIAGCVLAILAFIFLGVVAVTTSPNREPEQPLSAGVPTSQNHSAPNTPVVANPPDASDAELTRLGLLSNAETEKIKADATEIMRDIFGDRLKGVSVGSWAGAGGGCRIDVTYDSDEDGAFSFYRYRVEDKMRKAYQAIFTRLSGVHIHLVTIAAEGALTDQFGKESTSVVYGTRMTGDVAAQIVWDKADSLDFNQLWEVYWINSTLQQQQGKLF